MRKIFTVFIIGATILSKAQEPIIIDHNCIDLLEIPAEWIESAKANLYIGYGHTSHGSQLTSGMNAIESYYSDGKYNWSHDGGNGELHLFEGSGADEGCLDHDCGYEGWDEKTRVYLDSFPECNVIIWSWCGQVNDVDLLSHYLIPMEQLESDYPDVKFVYMTGHLEGLGPCGSLFKANQQIREYCDTNNKILFDFADIEKYKPYCDTNYQEYFSDDNCDYVDSNGVTINWADNWLANNPDHELTQISQLCGSCAHSRSLNCVKKGIACWYLWAQIAGWSKDVIPISQVSIISENDTIILTENSTLQLDVNVLPQNATNKKVEWKAENISGQAIIDSSGLVSAVEKGDVRIKAISENNPKARDSVLVRIIDSVIHIDSIYVYSTTGSSSVYENDTLQFAVNIYPENASDTTITWSISNFTGEATIDSLGNLLAVSEGKVIVIASSNDESNSTDFIYVDILKNTVNLNQSIEKQEQLIIYPNPSNGELFIYSDSEFLIEKIELIDPLGLTVFETNEQINTYNSKQKLNLPSLNRGIYYIKIIYSDDTYITQPVLIK
jgi:uncharacterized protein YjdB